MALHCVNEQNLETGKRFKTHAHWSVRLQPYAHARIIKKFQTIIDNNNIFFLFLRWPFLTIRSHFYYGVFFPNRFFMDFKTLLFNLSNTPNAQSMFFKWVIISSFSIDDDDEDKKFNLCRAQRESVALK